MMFARICATLVAFCVAIMLIFLIAELVENGVIEIDGENWSPRDTYIILSGLVMVLIGLIPGITA